MKKQTYTGNFRSYVDLNKVASENGGNVPDEIQVLPAGEFMTMPYGPMQITPEVFDVMIANFTAGVRAGVPVDTDHDGGEANGWFSELINKGDAGMWAKVDWNSLGKERLADKRYKFFSPEWSFDFVDPLNSTHHGAALIAGSLTNRPLFRTMERLVANETGKSGSDLTNKNPIVILLGSNTNMNNKDILAKPVAERSVEEFEFLKNATDLNDEEKVQVEKEVADKAAADEAAQKEADVNAEKAKEEAEAQSKIDEAKANEEKVRQEEEAKTAAEKKDLVTIKASELVELNKIKIAHDKALTQLRQVATEKEITETFVANAKGGKIYPAQKDGVIAFAMTCNDAQKKAFYDILKALPEIKVAGEIGDADKSHLTAQEEVNKLKVEKMKANDKLNAGQALQEVLRDNTALAKRYQEELQSK